MAATLLELQGFPVKQLSYWRK